MAVEGGGQARIVAEHPHVRFPLPREVRSVQAAANFATTAHAAANAIRSAVENQEFQAIGGARDALAGACRSCHTEYREQVEDGGYRIKPGVL